MNSIKNNEDEDEIKWYTKSNDHSTPTTIVAVLEGNYVRFARELDNGKLAEEKIVSLEEFEKMIKQEGWLKQQEDE